MTLILKSLLLLFMTHLDQNQNLTLSTDEDDGTQTEDDEHQHDQQPHQVGVQHGPPSAVEVPLVVREQDERPEPPGEKGRGQGRKWPSGEQG